MQDLLRWFFTQPDQTAQALHAALDRNGDPGMDMEMVRDIEHLQRLTAAAALMAAVAEILSQLQ